MTGVRSEKLDGFTAFVARVWHRLVQPARPQGVEDEVRFELLKGLVG